MTRSFARAAVALIVLLCGAVPALAAWQLRLGLGSREIQLRYELDASTELYLTCEGYDIYVILAVKDGREDQPPQGSFRLTLQGDTNPAPWVYPANVVRLRPGLLGYLNGDVGVINVIDDIRRAASAIDIALEDTVTGGVSRWTANSEGAASEGRAFLDLCLKQTLGPDVNAAPLEQPAPLPAPEPEVLPATANWRVAEGIDVASGKASTLLIGDLDTATALYARCVAGQPELFVDSYDGRDGALDAVGEVTLIITTDAGRTWTSPARHGREKSGYVTTTWLSGETISSVVADIAAARSSISVSIAFEEVGESTWDTDATGSTAAARRFLASCPASAAPAAAAEPAPQVLAETGVPWTVQARPESDGTISYSLNGESISGFGALLFACTSEGGIYAGFSTAVEDLPRYERGAALPMTITLGSRDYDFEANVAAVNDIAITVLSQDTGTAGIVADLLTLGVDSIAVTLRDTARDIEYVRQMGTNSATEAADEFLSRCEETADG